MRVFAARCTLRGPLGPGGNSGDAPLFDVLLGVLPVPNCSVRSAVLDALDDQSSDVMCAGVELGPSEPLSAPLARSHCSARYGCVTTALRAMDSGCASCRPIHPGSRGVPERNGMIPAAIST